MTENEGNIENAPSSLLQDSPRVQKKVSYLLIQVPPIPLSLKILEPIWQSFCQTET